MNPNNPRLPRASLTIAPDSLVLERRIGRGGMGEVWRARDERLGRTLAVKLLRPEGTEPVGLLLAEARAQARIDHPHVCKVYGFGELHGTPFIALQLIDGKPLARIAQTLTIDEKVRVVAQVASGIDAAHRHGLIHRDIKPHNILVERPGGGEVHAYIVDFGLARDVDKDTDPNIAGTVEYMAPEQAAGERVDGRTDVWGLGVTLYELFAGRTPFRAENQTATLRRLLSEDPRPIEGVPRDLGRIVMKCLERQPGRRYATAAELREDLERYLTGAPVKAMSPSLIYRLSKRANRQRFALGAGAFAAVVLVVSSVLVMRAQLRSAELARRSAEYARDIERFETTMHEAALLPLHDTRSERGLIETRLRAIEAALPALGPETAALAQHALGRGELALGQTDAAIAHLESAYAVTPTPEVGHAIGRALATRYAEELGAAANLPAVERNEHLKELAARYGGGIKRFLSIPTDQVGVLELARAQIAFAEERDDDALALVATAIGHQPWLFEAHRLRAQVEIARALRLSADSDYDGAEASLGRAEAAIGEALRIGPSDGTSRAVACQLGAISAQLAYDRSRLDAGRFVPWEAACNWALEVTGRSSEVLRHAANLAATHARYDAEHSSDGRAAYRRALALAQAATDANPKSAEAWIERAAIEGRLGRLEERDPILFEAAVASAERGARLAPRNTEALLTLAVALQDRATPADLLRAVELAEQATQLRPGFSAYNFLALVEEARALWQVGHGEDPREAYRAAFAAEEEVQRRSPNTDLGFVNSCAMASAYADFLLRQGDDADEVLDRGAQACRKSLEIDADYFLLYEIYADLVRTRAKRDLARGADISSALDEAASLLDRGRRISPSDDGFDWSEALLGLVRARALVRDGHQPRPAFAAVERALAAGRRHDPKNLWQMEVEASLARAKAEWLASQGQPVEKIALAGIAAVHARPDVVKGESGVDSELDEAALELARARATNGDKRRAYALAVVHLLEREVTANGNLAHLAAPLLDEARTLSAPDDRASPTAMARMTMPTQVANR
jgi:serine/threonine-protein kinase